MELYLGFALLAAWVIVIAWSLGKIAVSAWQGRKRKQQWDSRSFAAGLIVGAALVGGIALFVESETVFFGIHTVGLGFLLALTATFVLWIFAKAGSL